METAGSQKGDPAVSVFPDVSSELPFPFSD
jgi:hypothetical protein